MCYNKQKLTIYMIKSVYIGADSADYDFKKNLIKDLKSDGLVVVDLGIFMIEDKVTLEDLGREVGEKVAQDPESIGILIEKDGLNMCIVADEMGPVHSTVCLKSHDISFDASKCNTICLSEACMEYPETLQNVRKFIHSKNNHQ